MQVEVVRPEELGKADRARWQELRVQATSTRLRNQPVTASPALRNGVERMIVSYDA